MTLIEFLEARLETDRGEAQYVLNLMSAGDAPVMYGSLRTAIEHSCERVLADVEAKREIIKLHTGDHRCGWWPRGCATMKRLASDYSEHSDYQEVGRP